MLNWGALIGEREAVENAENSPPSGELPHYSPTVSDKVGKSEPSNYGACKVNSPLSPPSPLKKQGDGLDIENEERAGGGATVKFSDEKTHPVSPFAVCLLLACCDKIKADEQEIAEAIMSLRNYPPSEQVRWWVILCNDNEIDSVQVQRHAMPSLGEGVACSDCDHITMNKVEQPSGRRVFRFGCGKQYAVLELGFAGERVLIAPPECSDYAGRCGSPLHNSTA